MNEYENNDAYIHIYILIIHLIYNLEEINLFLSLFFF